MNRESIESTKFSKERSVTYSGSMMKSRHSVDCYLYRDKDV